MKQMAHTAALKWYSGNTSVFLHLCCSQRTLNTLFRRVLLSSRCAGALTDIHPCLHACLCAVRQQKCVSVHGRTTEARVCWNRACVCVLVYAPGRTYAGVDCGAGVEVRGAVGVCQVRGLQLLIAGWYIDTDRGI